jgi:hypothetical protein
MRLVVGPDQACGGTQRDRSSVKVLIFAGATIALRIPAKMARNAGKLTVRTTKEYEMSE